MCNLGLSMRLPQCFESYCTPVDDLELLNGRFVDPHYERGFSLANFSDHYNFLFHYYQRRLLSLVLASPPHLYHMSRVFTFLFRRCFFPRKKKKRNLISPLEFPRTFEYSLKSSFSLQDQVSLSFSLSLSLSLRVFASCSSKKRTLYIYLLDSLFLNFFFVRELERVSLVWLVDPFFFLFLF